MKSRALLRYLRFLPIVAVLFAAIYLYRHAGVAISLQRFDPSQVLIASVLAIVVFFIRAWIWYRMLRESGVGVSYRAALTSRFYPIFAKYIPGKVWGLLGPAQVISESTGSMGFISAMSFYWSLVIVTGGLALGVIGFAVLGVPAGVESGQLILLVCLIVVLLGVVYSGLLNTVIARLMRRSGYDVQGYRLPRPERYFLVSVLQWLLMGVAFSVFFRAMGVNAGLWPLLLQGFANTVGMVAVFVPAGLGVREAVMVAYLSAAGVKVADALVLALVSRIWFFAIEFILFLLGVAMKMENGKGRR